MFLTRSATLERNIDIGGVSVRPIPSSHAGIASKLTIVGSCGFHRRTVQGV